jgi:geranylgeranyl reductase family protein
MQFFLMSDKNTYDVIIIGAGPAGSTATLYAKQNNLNILLLEKESFPRDKICGDAVSGKSMSVLLDLGLLDEAKNLPGRVIDSIIFGSPSNYQVNVDLVANEVKGIPAALCVKRQIFDNFLFEKAKSKADHCIENFKVNDVLFENGFVKGIAGKRKGSSTAEEFFAPLIIGADGYNSIVARKTGLYDHDPNHWVVALRQYYKNIKGLNNQLEIYYIKEAQPGYFWIFPLDDGQANIGIGMLHKTIKNRKINLKEVLRQTINSPVFGERFADAEPMENPTGWNLPVGSKHRKNHGNGFMLLGDAAGLIDPFTGEGIGNALFSAKYAIETAVRAKSNNDYSEAFLSDYDTRLWQRLGNELSVSSKLQKVGRMQTLLDFVIGKAQRKKEVEDIISGMMRNDIPKKQLANPLFYLKLLFT